MTWHYCRKVQQYKMVVDDFRICLYCKLCHNMKIRITWLFLWLIILSLYHDQMATIPHELHPNNLHCGLVESAKWLWDESLYQLSTLSYPSCINCQDQNSISSHVLILRTNKNLMDDSLLSFCLMLSNVISWIFMHFLM